MPHWTEFLEADGPDGAYLPWKKVEPRVGISRTTAWRLQRSGDFPRPYVVSPGRVAYRESEVEAWKASRGHRHAEQRQPLPLLDPPECLASPAAEPASFAADPPPQLPLSSPAPALAPSPQRASRPRRQPPVGNQMRFEF